MARFSLFIRASVIWNLSFFMSEINAAVPYQNADHGVIIDESQNDIRRNSVKPRIFYDYQTRIVAYKDLVETRCLLEILTSGESFLRENYQKQHFDDAGKGVLISENQLSKQEVWSLGGQRISDFCKGFPTFLIHDLSDISDQENELDRRVKRSTRHYFVGRVRGQTQSQYLNYGSSKDPGKAEAESTYEGSKAVVTGSSGMGQAQSQSSPLDCADCYGQGTGYDQSQVLQAGFSGEDQERGQGRRPQTGIPSYRPGVDFTDQETEQKARYPSQIRPGGVSRGERPGGVSRGERPGSGRFDEGGTDYPGQYRPGTQTSGSRTPGRDDSQGGTQETGYPSQYRPEGSQVPEQVPGGSRGERPGSGRFDQGEAGYPGQYRPGGTQISEQGPGGDNSQEGIGVPGHPRPGGSNIPDQGAPGTYTDQGGRVHTGYPGQVGGYPSGQQIPEGEDQDQSYPGTYRPGGPSTTEEGRYPISGQPGTGSRIPGRISGGSGREPGRPSAAGPHIPGYIQQTPGGPKLRPSGQGPQYPGYDTTQTRVPGQGGVSRPTGIPSQGEETQPQGIPGQIPGRQPGGYYGESYPSQVQGGKRPTGPGRGRFSGQLDGEYNSHTQDRGRFSGTFSGQYEPFQNGHRGTGSQTDQYGRPAQGAYDRDQGFNGGRRIPQGTVGFPQGPSRGEYPGVHGLQGTGQPGEEGSYLQPGLGGGPGQSAYPGSYETGSTPGTIGGRVPSRPGTTSYPGSEGDTGYPGRLPGQTGIPGQTTYPDGSYETGRTPGTIGGRVSSRPEGSSYPGGEEGTGYPGRVGYPVGNGIPGQTAHPGSYEAGRAPGTIGGRVPLRPGVTLHPGGEGATGYPGGEGEAGYPGGVSYPGGTGLPGETGIGQTSRPGYPSSRRPGYDQSRIPGSPESGANGGISRRPGYPSPGTQQGEIPGGTGIPYGLPGEEEHPEEYGTQTLPGGVRPGDITYPGGQPGRFPGGSVGVPGQGRPGTTIDESDDADSQAESSVHQTNNITQASALAQGFYGGRTAQSEVSGSYTGTGSFSASAGTDDGKRGALTQVSGGKEGAMSSAQGRGGSGKSQAEVQLSAESGDTVSNSQTSGLNHSSQTKVQASGTGGSADAQSNGPGLTSSQAQIGFTPYNEQDTEDQETPFKGGGTASAQSGSYSGQSQSQIQGKFNYGIRYTGGAQAGSGPGKRNRTIPSTPFNFSTFKPFVSEQKQQLQSANTSSSGSSRTARKMTVVQPEPQIEEEDTTGKPVVEEHDEEYYDYEEESASKPVTKSIVSQISNNQKQHIILDPLEDIDATVLQSSGYPSDGTILQPGEMIPGSPGYKIPVGFRGRVKSVATGSDVFTSGQHSQAQSVSLTPGAGRIIYKQPLHVMASNTHLRNSRIGYGSQYTASYYQNPNGFQGFQLKSGESIPQFVAQTRAESGAQNPKTGRKSNVFYTQSSSCGSFTNKCAYKGQGKICVPRTQPDGTLTSC